MQVTIANNLLCDYEHHSMNADLQTPHNKAQTNLHFNPKLSILRMEPITRELVCSVDHHSITIKLQNDKLLIRAYSQNSVKQFTGEFTISTFPEDLRMFGGCKEIFDLVEESIQQDQKAVLSDVGQLIFPFLIKVGKLQVTKHVQFDLKETAFDETQISNIRIDRLENEVKNLRAQIEKMNELGAQKTCFEIDTNTISYHRFKFDSGNINIVCNSSDKWIPLICKKPITKHQKYDFEIVYHGNQRPMFGIITADLKGHENNLNEKVGSVSLSRNSIYSEGTVNQFLSFWVPKTGKKIAMVVNLMNFTVEWLEEYPFIGRIAKVNIPVDMRDKPLFAYFAMYDSSNQTIIKLL